MRALVLFALGSVVMCAQTGGGRCEVVERVDLAGGADLLMRDRDHRLYRCFAELDKLGLPAVRPGDVVEWAPGFDSNGRCRMASLRLIGRVDEVGSSNYRLKLDLNPLNTLVRRGNVSRGGVIAHIDSRALEIRTTRGERFRFLLRNDTHYFRDGLPAAVRELVLNQVVSVRAGRNLEGQFEAFYVMWGEILRPGSDSAKPD